LLAPAARGQRKADFAWRRRRTLLMCLVADRSLRGAAATAAAVESGGGGGAEGAPQTAQFELKPVPWAAFLARYRAAAQQAEAGGAQAAGAGGAGGDAGARLGEFLAFGVPEDKLLLWVLAYL